MPAGKREVLEMLRELAQLTLLDEENPQSFRVRAYESAEHAIHAQTVELSLLSVKELQQIEGIGKSTAEKIRELIDTGRVERLEALREKHPEGVVALLRIQGLGPKMLGRLRSQLGVQSLDDLRRLLGEQRLRGLKGFGEKSEEKLRQAVARLEAEGALGRTPIALALPLAEGILEELRAAPGVTHALVAGSLRRFSETIGDIDIIVTAAEPEPVMQKLTGLSVVAHVLAQGEGKTSIVTRRGVQVDLRVVAEHQLGAALLYFTGSKGHNIKLRQRALERGLTLNEYSLSELEGGKSVASETEASIYAALGLAFIPPVLREDAGEIEAAESGRLPPALPGLSADFHVHTSVSGDAQSPLEDMVRGARERGYRILAITEHAEGTRAGVSRTALLEQAEHLRALQAELGDALLLLHGIELNIGAAGELDYDPEFRRQFAFCIASVHSHFELPREAQTERILRAIADPCVRMLGHLSARHIGSRPGIELDLGRVLAAAESSGVALEVNGALERLDLSVEALRHARQRRVHLVLTSDAHHEQELSRIQYAALNAQRAWVDPAQIVNTWPERQLLDWVAARR